MKRRDIFLAILVAFAWGSNYIAVKYTIIEIPGLLSIAIRFLITALLLLPFVSRPSRTNFKDLYVTSLIVGIFNLGLLYYGLYLGLNPSLVIITMQLNIPISIIIARFVLKEHFNLSSVMGIIIAFIGMFIVVGSPHLKGHDLAFTMILFSAFFCAVFNIQSRKLQSIPALSLVCWTNLIAAPHLFVMSYFLEGNPFYLLEGVSNNLWIAMAYTIVIAGFVGWGLWIYLLQTYPVYKVLPFNLLIPFFGISLSITMLGDIPSWHILLGGIITIAGVAISQIRILPFMVNKRL